jgi:hypothetical protein
MENVSQIENPNIHRSRIANPAQQETSGYKTTALNRYALKGQPAVSPGQRPGYAGNTHKRPEWAKALLTHSNAFAHTLTLQP